MVRPDPESMSRIVDLRERVICDEEGLGRTAARKVGLIVEDALDASAFHFVVRHEEAIVAAARLTLHENMNEVPATRVYDDFALESPAPIGAFGRAVVTKVFRSYGLGALLDLARYRKAQQTGCNTLVTYAHPWRAGMLSELGFRVLGRVNMPALYPGWPKEFERVAMLCRLAPCAFVSPGTVEDQTRDAAFECGLAYPA